MKYQEGDELLVNRWSNNLEDNFIWYLEVIDTESQLDFQSRGSDIYLAYGFNLIDENGDVIRSYSAFGNDMLDSLDEFDGEPPDTERPEIVAECRACHEETMQRLIEGLPWDEPGEWPGDWHCTECCFTFYPSAMHEPADDLYLKIEELLEEKDDIPERLRAWADERMP